MHRDHIKGLDGIRAIAVLLVVATHLHVFQWLATRSDLFAERALPMVHGRTGVLAFFVLSGFLITHLLLKEHRDNGVVSFRNFYIRRSLRIFPLYFLVVFLTIALAAVGNKVLDWSSIPYALTYTYNFVPAADYSPILGHTWSLAVEEHFYLIWPALFAAFIARKRRVLLLSLLAAYVAGYFIHLGLTATGLDDLFFVRRWTVVAGGSIALGAALAMLIDHGAAWLRNPLVAVLGLALFSHSIVAGDIDPGGDQIRALGIALVIGWLFLNQQSLPADALELGPLSYLGKISYGVYMWQGFFLATGPGREPGQTWPPSPAMGLVLLCAVAPLSYHVFEVPFLRLKRRFSGPRTQREWELHRS